MIIISLDILANFVDPAVHLSKDEMNFRRDTGPENTVEFLVGTYCIN